MPMVELGGALAALVSAGGSCALVIDAPDDEVADALNAEVRLFLAVALGGAIEGH